MGTRRERKMRHVPKSIDLRTVKCQADGCTLDAKGAVEIDGNLYDLCRVHGDAVGRQKRRNLEAELGLA